MKIKKDRMDRNNLIDNIIKTLSKDPWLFLHIYTDFLEQYGWKFRECEGLLFSSDSP